MAHSAIVIPVPALEPLVRPRMQRALPGFVFADPNSVHAHVTVLGPFVSAEQVGAELLDRLRGIFARTRPFAFTVAGTRHTFEDGTVYLKPEPAEPFCALTDTLWRAYPGYPPYGSPSTAPLPHVTLAYGWAPSVGDVDEAEPAFPIRCTAAMACLNWYEPGRSTTMASFVLGGAEGAAVA
ncbi:2'-5' RNA ligase family protein [Micromonospora sp. CA-249363]|uniref:2'-5' RNA ligase family protein n=1 Tax=Micromonospora sp. CA-249363 TaxID=3239963 RepID=UPI003D8AA149